jgi:hypothetical protein
MPRPKARQPKAGCSRPWRPERCWHVFAAALRSRRSSPLIGVSDPYRLDLVLDRSLRNVLQQDAPVLGGAFQNANGSAPRTSVIPSRTAARSTLCLNPGITGITGIPHRPSRARPQCTWPERHLLQIDPKGPKGSARPRHLGADRWGADRAHRGAPARPRRPSSRGLTAPGPMGCPSPKQPQETDARYRAMSV